jgi:superfamily I DNA/RNA helicase
LKKFCVSIIDDQYEMAFRITEEKHKVMTVFASKGLEFSQVISFSHYYPIYNNDKLENHYVCITRAKEKFIMFINDYNYLDNLKITASNNEIDNLSAIAKIR